VVSFREFKLTRFAPGGKVADPVDEPAAWARLSDLAGLPALPLSAAARAWAAINGRDVPTGA
jgi:hypothetical protein